jgi:hypothetical protein
LKEKRLKEEEGAYLLLSLEEITEKITEYSLILSSLSSSLK